MKGKKKGRQSWFYRAFKWLEGGTDPCAISEFEPKIKENANSDYVFSKMYQITFLKQRYDKFINSTQFQYLRISLPT